MAMSDPTFDPSQHAAGMTLMRGLTELGLSLDASQIAQLQDYLRLIQKWNQVYNLTAVRNPDEMLTHHLLDSLSVIAPLRRHLAERKAGWVHQARALTEAQPPLPGAVSALKADALGERQPGPLCRLLDVGSGAGLPGVVMAICCPEVAVSCVDTVGKKAAFIQQAALSLKLPNLVGIHARVEHLSTGFDVITSRAFASLKDFTQWSQAALADGGVWMAMKGKHPADEIAQLRGTDVFHVEQLHVPGLNAERCLLWLRPSVSPQA